MLVELNERDAALFKLFMQHYEQFTLLVDNRVFDLRNGHAEIHFDPQGEIASIDLHAKVFKRVKLPSATVVKVKSVL